MELTVSLPYPWLLEAVTAELGGVEGLRLVAWDVSGEPKGAAVEELDAMVLPFHSLEKQPQAAYVSIQTLRAALPRAVNARHVQTLSVGVEGIAECLPFGATLHNARGVMEGQTAELAASLILALRRDLPGFLASQGRWDNRRTPGLVGKRVLLLGYGGVGAALERRLRGFDADIVTVARTARIAPGGQRVHGIAELDDLLPSADVVAVTLPLTEQTRGIVDASFLRRMKDGASLVNVGRGAIVDTEALLEELRAGRLTAGLDVTDPEPLPEGHPLWTAPGTIVTPHVGGATDAMTVQLVELVIAQIRRLLASEPAANLVSSSSSSSGGGLR